MHDRSLSFVVALALGSFLSACGDEEAVSTSPPVERVEPAGSATTTQPPPTPMHELAAPPANPGLPNRTAPSAAEEPPQGVIGKVKANLARANRGRTMSEIVAIESALENYAINNSGRYPDTLVVLVTPDVNGETYLRNPVLPKDAWDRDYVYEPPSPGNPLPKIYTLGRDGRAGGTGEDADVDNISIRARIPD